MSAALALGQRAWSTARIVWGAPFAVRFRGVLQALLASLLLVAMISWNPADPSLNAASTQGPTNWLGATGAVFADLMMQSLGLAAWPAVLLLIAFGLATAIGDALQHRLQPTAFKIFCAVTGVLLLSAALSALAAPAAWRLAAGLGGLWIRQLQQELTELKRQSEQIRRDYQRRDDAAKTDDQLLDMLREVKTHIQRIEDKLDRKADK